MFHEGGGLPCLLAAASRVSSTVAGAYLLTLVECLSQWVIMREESGPCTAVSHRTCSRGVHLQISESPPCRALMVLALTQPPLQPFCSICLLLWHPHRGFRSLVESHGGVNVLQERSSVRLGLSHPVLGLICQEGTVMMQSHRGLRGHTLSRM